MIFCETSIFPWQIRRGAESAVEGRCSFTSSKLLDTVTATSSPAGNKEMTHLRGNMF